MSFKGRLIKLIKMIKFAKLKKRIFIHIKLIYIYINNKGGDNMSEIPYKIT